MDSFGIWFLWAVVNHHLCVCHCQCVSSILGELPYFLSNSLFCIGEGVRWDFEKGSYVWRVCPLFSGEEGIFLPRHDVSGVPISGMVIFFDVLGASDEMGVKKPDTAEARSSLYFINRPYGRPDVFCTVFHHACYLHGIYVVRPLGSLFLTTIYRSGVFGNFNLYALTAVYRRCVFALRTRDTFSNRNLPVRYFHFRIVK